ncbi:DNA helicase RecQ [Ectothiorhodospiraceae bacterium WFHF3C12]|nr:DNA helicase RecQ [Ectothiorhodospiraceae bacterium WFHF3C12]
MSQPGSLSQPPVKDPHACLRQVFGYQDFRGNQQAVVEAVMAGRNALVLMPTGGGKSLCYQVPALCRQGTAVVISPLIALMRDQVEAMKHLGVRAAYLNSTLTPGEAAEVRAALAAGELDLLYVAPERLLQEQTLTQLDRVELALVAIDEAHCVSQWGHDFRPEYLRLRELIERFPGVPRLALTATADLRTRREILEQLFPDEGETYLSSFDRPNIRYRVGRKDNPKQQLLRFIREEHEGESGIVYCMSRRKTEEYAAWLDGQGIPAIAYHAGLDGEIRRHHQQRFVQEEGLVVVATVAFGMGIDKPDVRFVAHLDLPKSVEAYYQETGRAGRDGLAADAWMVYGLQDVYQLRQLIAASDAGELHKRNEQKRLDALLAYCEGVACRRRTLLAYFDEAHPGDCGNCDNCLQPVETWDATEAAQKALSCIYRTGQRYGAAYIADVLRGVETDRIREAGHDRLSVFGIGEALDKRTWQSVIRQLMALGYLQADPEGYGGLRLDERCRALLRGEETVRLRWEKGRQRSRATQRRSTVSAEDQPLWEALRAHRRHLAESEGVPPYVIFHDATLQEMAARRPGTLDALAGISGVGQYKLDRYGEEFIAVIRAYEHGVDARDFPDAE